MANVQSLFPIGDDDRYRFTELHRADAAWR